METDQKFVQYSLEQLCDRPEEISIERTVDDLGVLLTVRVAREDMGKIIGRSGATAKAIRCILRAIGMRNSSHVNMKIEEPEGAPVVA